MPWTDREIGRELNGPFQVPQPGRQGRDLKPRLTLGLSPGCRASGQASLISGVCSQEAPLLSSGKCAPEGWAGHTPRLDRNWAQGRHLLARSLTTSNMLTWRVLFSGWVLGSL